MTDRRFRGFVVHLVTGAELRCRCTGDVAHQYATAVSVGTWIDIPISDDTPRGTGTLRSLRTINPAHVTHMEVHR